MEIRRALSPYGVCWCSSGDLSSAKDKSPFEHTEENQLIISNMEGKVIATHAIYPGAGETVGGSNYKRELEEKISYLDFS